MKQYILPLFTLLIVLATGCQKEFSSEQGNQLAEGSLQETGGDCLPKVVSGVYIAGTPLTNANTIQVTVNVTVPGRYEILTDTVNGYFFRGVGLFALPGANIATLVGNGTPFVNRTDNFRVSFDSTFCNVAVDVVQVGAGSLTGSPNACAPITVNGVYSPGVGFTAANTAVVQANISSGGTLSFTTDTVDGMWFNYAGAFSTGPAQNVTLQARGAIPSTATTGAKTFRVRLGTSSCTFTVNFAGPAAGTISCTTPTISGTYTAAQAMAAGNTVQLAANVTTSGAYSITTDTVNGVWFNTSGTFAATGSANFTLTGNGTPANPGTFTYTVKWGTSTCTISITFAPPLSTDYFPRTANSNWSYETDDDPLDSLYVTAITPTLTAAGNVYNIFMDEDGIAPGLDSSGYFRKSGGDYFQRLNFEDFGSPTPIWTELLILKDNVAAGSAAWLTPSATGVSIVVGPTTYQIRFSNQVISKDISVPLTTSTSPSPVTYNNVIVVEQKAQINVPVIGWQDATAIFGSIKTYYARGIGLIKTEIISTGGTLTQELRRYQVF